MELMPRSMKIEIPVSPSVALFKGLFQVGGIVPE